MFIIDLTIGFLICILILIYILRKQCENSLNYWTKHKTTGLRSARSSIFSGDWKEFVALKTNFGFHLRAIYEDRKFKSDAAVGIYSFLKPGLLIREPELIKKIFVKDFHNFSNRTDHTCSSYDPLGAFNIFFAKYNHWREMRPKLTPIFTSGKLKNMFPLVQQIGENLERYLNEQGEHCIVELKELAGRYSTDIIASTIMGFNSNALCNPKDRMYAETHKLSAYNAKRAWDFLLIFFANKQINQILRPKVFYDSTEKFMRSSIKSVMAERERMGGKRNDLIDLFIQLKNEAENKGEDIEKCMEDLSAQAAILMTGGFDTSASTISSALLELAKNQEVQNRLRQEILQAYLKDKGTIKYETITKMEYLQMVIDETLRLYPVLPMLDRRYEPSIGSTAGFSLKPFNDYVLKPGMPIYVSVLGLHYDPKYWPEPTKFKPERFSAAKKAAITPMSYVPFGVGPHNCIGGRLGLLQVKVGLTHVLKNYCIRVCSQTVVQPVFDPKVFVLQIKGGVYAELVRDNLYENEVD